MTVLRASGLFATILVLGLAACTCPAQVAIAGTIPASQVPGGRHSVSDIRPADLARDIPDARRLFCPGPPSMILKHIVCAVAPMHREAFSNGQLAWAQLRQVPGFIAQFGGFAGNEARLFGLWTGPESYNAFMSDWHDRIESDGRQREHIGRITVNLYDVLDDSLDLEALKNAIESSSKELWASFGQQPALHFDSATSVQVTCRLGPMAPASETAPSPDPTIRLALSDQQLTNTAQALLLSRSWSVLGLP